MSANLVPPAYVLSFAIVEEHVSRENAHDLPGIMATLWSPGVVRLMNPGVNTTKAVTRCTATTRTF